MKQFNYLFVSSTLLLVSSCQQIADKSDFNVGREDLIIQENQNNVDEYDKVFLSMEESDKDKLNWSPLSDMLILCCIFTAG